MNNSLAPSTLPPLYLRLIETTKIDTPPLPTCLNGFVKALHGQEIRYFSTHPDVENGRVVRSKRPFLNTEWETDIVPIDSEGAITFVWMAAIGGPQWAPHTFQFSVNQQKLFSMSTCADLAHRNWTQNHPTGASLRFHTLVEDTHSDLFGYFFLTLPPSLYSKGTPVKITVEGNDENSSDWMIFFDYQFSHRPQFRLEPLILNTPTGAKQSLRMLVDTFYDGIIDIKFGSEDTLSYDIKLGTNRLEIPIPLVEQPSELMVYVEYPNQPKEMFRVPVQPVGKREIYLVAYSHNDIGYTHHQSVVEKKQWSNIEQAIILWEQTQYRPTGEISKWNIEVLWALDTWLNQTSKEWQKRFWEAVWENGIGLNGFYANFLTGLTCEKELEQFTRYATKIREKHSVTLDSVVMTDIPGCTWGVVKSLSNHQFKYFLSAPNESDRVGHIYDMGDDPFYWVDPSGEHQVLFWIAGASYSLFHRGELSKLGDERLLQYLRKLDLKQYPYELVVVPYTIGGDNGPPDPTLPDFVTEWNQRYASPKLKIATISEWFHDFEDRYSSQIPKRSGDLTPYWEDGAISTAREVTIVRNAVDMLIQSESIHQNLLQTEQSTQRNERAWDQILLFDEHTWGAFNSVSEPDLPDVKAQWLTKRGFARKAYKKSLALLKTSCIEIEQTYCRNSDFVVVNSHPWQRSGWVYVLNRRRFPQVSHEDHVYSLYTKHHSSKLFVKDMKPYEVRPYYWASTSPPQTEDGLKLSYFEMENSFLKVTVNPESGTISSLISKSTHTEWIDPSSLFGFGEFLTVQGFHPKDAIGVKQVAIIPRMTAYSTELIIKGVARGCSSWVCTFRLYAGCDELEIVYEFVKMKNRQKEAIHVAFPIGVPRGVVRYDVPGGVVQPEQNQLDGSCKNYFSAQSWFDVSNDEIGMVVAMPDSFLIETEDLIAETGWRKKASDKPPVFAYLLNNYWHTNYKADQRGPMRFRFVLKPHSQFSATDNHQFAMGVKQPLLTVVKNQIDTSFAYWHKRVRL